MKNNNDSFLYLIFFGLFAGCLVIAALAGSKLVQIGPFLMDGGLLIYAATFVITDIVAEVYGKKYAMRIAQSGFFTLIAAYCALQVSFILPAAAEWELAKEYEAIMGMGSRVFLAACVSFVISQYADITIFSYLRRKTDGRHLWLRNNLSTMAGGGLDAIIFTTIAFYGVFPVLPIIVSAFIVRVIFSILDTPIVYTVVWLLNFKALRPTSQQL